MAQRSNVSEATSARDLKRMLSREYEDYLDWLENQERTSAPRPTPQHHASQPTTTGPQTAFREWIGRFRRAAGGAE